MNTQLLTKISTGVLGLAIVATTFAPSSSFAAEEVITTNIETTEEVVDLNSETTEEANEELTLDQSISNDSLETEEATIELTNEEVEDNTDSLNTTEQELVVDEEGSQDMIVDNAFVGVTSKVQEALAGEITSESATTELVSEIEVETEAKVEAVAEAQVVALETEADSNPEVSGNSANGLTVETANDFGGTCNQEPKPWADVIVEATNSNGVESLQIFEAGVTHRVTVRGVYTDKVEVNQNNIDADFFVSGSNVDDAERATGRNGLLINNTDFRLADDFNSSSRYTFYVTSDSDQTINFKIDDESYRNNGGSILVEVAECLGEEDVEEQNSEVQGQTANGLTVETANDFGGQCRITTNTKPDIFVQANNSAGVDSLQQFEAGQTYQVAVLGDYTDKVEENDNRIDADFFVSGPNVTPGARATGRNGLLINNTDFRLADEFNENSRYTFFVTADETGFVNFKIDDESYANNGDGIIIEATKCLPQEEPTPEDEEDNVEEVIEEETESLGGGGQLASARSSNDSDDNDSDGEVLGVTTENEPQATSGEVLGQEIKACEAPLLTQYLNDTNNPDTIEVLKLQFFLNVLEGNNLSYTGTYDVATKMAVMNYQANYAAEVLTPWNLTEPTGYVYLTTRKHINERFCDNYTEELPVLTPDSNIQNVVIN